MRQRPHGGRLLPPYCEREFLLPHITTSMMCGLIDIRPSAHYACRDVRLALYYIPIASFDFSDHRFRRDHRVYSFTLNEVRRLHHVMEKGYRRWVEGAPRGFFKSEFFNESTPILISCMYGQNQPICNPVSAELERRMWFEERDYNQIRYFSFAIASHSQ
jgi:hypothetical protein